METSATLKEDPCFSLLEPHVASSVSALSRLLGILSWHPLTPAGQPWLTKLAQCPRALVGKKKFRNTSKKISFLCSWVASPQPWKKNSKKNHKTSPQLLTLLWKTLQLRLIKLLNLQRCKITLVSYCSKRNWHFVAVVAAAVWGDIRHCCLFIINSYFSLTDFI